MNVPYSPPSFNSQAFNCPFCGVYANQVWYTLGRTVYNNNIGRYIADSLLSNTMSATCSHCSEVSFWVRGSMVYPIAGTAPLPNPDMPDDVKQDYEEARSIVSISPRGASALLRLAIQKLCKHLGEGGENINADIASMVRKGLPEPLQQALDSVRVVGNNAVHPGQINFNDDASIAGSLFGLVNIICDNRITQPKMISQYYYANVPAETRGHIAKRDGK